MIFSYFCKIFVPRSKGPPLRVFTDLVANLYSLLIFLCKGCKHYEASYHHFLPLPQCFQNAV